MEKALNGYSRLTGCQATDGARFNINIYARKKDYENAALKHGFPENATTGFYTPVPPAAIHLPYTRKDKKYLYSNLLHEGTHQFLSRLPGYKVPLWLNEGMACYMEAAVTDNGIFEFGRVNSARLKHLKRLTRANRSPSLCKVLSRRYGECFSSADYAVSWGVVYVLQQDPDKRERFLEYFKACQDPEDPLPLLKSIIVGEASTLKAWEEDWKRAVNRL